MQHDAPSSTGRDWWWEVLLGRGRRASNVLAIGAGIVVAICIAMAWRAAYRAAAESPQHAILVEAERLLNNFHAVNGHYPETLEELPFRFYGDGRPETLKLFEYQSDGEHYALVTHSVVTGDELKSCK